MENLVCPLFGLSTLHLKHVDFTLVTIGDSWLSTGLHLMSRATSIFNSHPTGRTGSPLNTLTLSSVMKINIEVGNGL